jgi:hypothetical protein
MNKVIVLSIYPSIYGSTILVDLGRFSNFLIYKQFGRTPSDGGSAHRKAATYTQNKRKQTYMP